MLSCFGNGGTSDWEDEMQSVLVHKVQVVNLEEEEDEAGDDTDTTMPQSRGSKATKRRKASSSSSSGAGDHNGSVATPLELRYENRQVEKKERERIVLWRKPVTTLSYFIRELCVVVIENSKKLWRWKFLVFAVSLVIGLVTMMCSMNGPHQKLVTLIWKQFLWCAYWVGLGVLSSVGLGTGLHTFLLYLGPHIASVTLAAYECGSLNFPEPPYPDEIVCPEDEASGGNRIITLWSIMSKVRLEAFMWGAGTALGELPPYFMARAARLSGFDADDGELEEFEELLNQRNHPEVQQSSISRAKLAIQRLVERVGFFGILACASIPNPLFDLAGITCGHFLVPFWTFFGATLIGKAVIKMHIQKLFVIIAFNEALVERAVNVSEFIPYVGKYLHSPFREFLEKQKAKLHRKMGARSPQEASWLSAIFEKLVIAMVVYFIISIVNSLAQRYHKRLYKRSQWEYGHKVAKD